MKKLTRETFKPSPDMIHAAEAVFTCMAFVETIKPIVTGYQQKILDHYKFPVAAKWLDRGRVEMDVVVNPDHTYLMEEDDFQFYLAECRKEQAKAGLKTEKPEFCPLLVAENLLVQAQWVLVDSMESVTGLSKDKLLCSHNGLENYKKYIDLTLRLLAPFVKNPLGKVA